MGTAEFVQPSAIIIGASSGIGLELTKLLAARGVRLGIAARRMHLLEQHAKMTTQICCMRTMDVSQPEAATKTLVEMLATMGTVDFIYLSAGTGHLNPDLRWQLEDETIRVNVLGFAALAAAALRFFLEQGHGHLIGISSVAALRGSPVAPAYNASKAFESSYLQGLRYRAMKSSLPIFVTEIRPGFVDTAMMKAERPFWMTSPAVAARQIVRAVTAKKSVVYVTRRWGLIAWGQRLLPDALFSKIS